MELLIFHSVFIVQIAQQSSFGLFPTITVNLMIMCMRGVPLPYFCFNVKIYSVPYLKLGPVFLSLIKNSVHPHLALIFWQKRYSSKIGATYLYWHSSCSTQPCPLLSLLQLSFSYLQTLHMPNFMHFGFGGWHKWENSSYCKRNSSLSAAIYAWLLQLSSSAST